MLNFFRRCFAVLGLLSALLSLPASHAAAPATTSIDRLIEEAFIYAYPVYEFARTRYQATSAQNAETSALNRLVHLRKLSDHTDRWVTTPNNDTLYSSAFLDLSKSPVELVTPEFSDRYFSVALLDAFTNNFAIIGRRTTGTHPQKYLIVGPHWKGKKPNEVKIIRAPGNWVWLLARTLIQGPADLATVHALQDGITLRVTKPFSPETSLQPIANDAANFIAVVNQAMASNPPPSADQATLTRIAQVGIGVQAAAPDPAILQAWQAAYPSLRKKLASFAQATQPLSVRNGWTYNPAHLGNFGNFGTDYGLRAVVALVGLAALPPEEAVYSSAATDQYGAALKGDQRYHWHIPAEGLPVNAFWSLSAYEVTAEGALFFADNPLHRYAIGDRTAGLQKNADGSIDIFIQNVAPATEQQANWLPIPPGPVRLILRAYQAQPALLQGQYRFPTIERLP